MSWATRTAPVTRGLDGNAAVFQGSSGTVTIASAVSATSITFNTANYAVGTVGTPR